MRCDRGRVTRNQVLTRPPSIACGRPHCSGSVAGPDERSGSGGDFLTPEEKRVALRPGEQAASGAWTIEGAEALLSTLPGIISARVVARPGGQVDEVHLLTTEEVSPKQTVRNVESALRAHYDIVLDHRKVSVARTRSTGPAAPSRSAYREPVSAGAVVTPLRRGATETSAESARIVFIGHQVESERAQRVRMRVTLEWEGRPFQGEATGPDLPRPRLETLAVATLGAIAAILDAADEPGDGLATLDLDGVRTVDAFDRTFVLVAVHGLQGRSVVPLSGAAAVEAGVERAVILATLQATDRWVRGRL